MCVCVITARPQRDGRGHTEPGGTMGPSSFQCILLLVSRAEVSLMNRGEMEEYVERGQLRGWGSPGR